MATRNLWPKKSRSSTRNWQSKPSPPNKRRGPRSSLRLVAGAAGRPALFPQLLPIPEPVHDLFRQRKSELMRQHQHLPAMVRFVRNHVAQHFRPNRPRPSPAVSDKLSSAAPAAERLRKHLRAASGALRQSRAGLLRRAVRALQLPRSLQVRRRKPDPLGADIVHVREDRRNRAGLAGWFGIPRGRVQMLKNHLFHPLIRGKNPHRRSPQLGRNKWRESLLTPNFVSTHRYFRE